jgi:hypothetical protein
MYGEETRHPKLIPHLDLTERVLDSPLGHMVTGFHVHSVDDTLDTIFTEAVVGVFHKLPVRSIRSHPSRPISLGPRTLPGHIDHIAVDFLQPPFPSINDFDSLKSLYLNDKILMQEYPNCCGILVTRKLWVYSLGYPPLEIALGPKTQGTKGCDPRPAWPS